MGAGLQIAPNGARVLDALGIEVPSVASEAVHLIDGPSGRSLIRMPLGAGFRLVHRADLIDALADAARLRGVSLRLGARVIGVDDGVIRTTEGIVFANRVVGADGARGATRAHVVPDHVPAFTGQVAWRATLPLSEPWPAEAQVHVGPGRHLVLYPLRGGTQLNVVAVEERAVWAAEGWSQEDDPAALSAAFASYAPPVRDLLGRIERVFLWGLMDHGLSACWGRGRCTLIGDAAHPTLPFLAQGANLALEDAWTLAGSWCDPATWEARRRPRVARALLSARANASNYHLTGLHRTLAHTALRLAGSVAPTLPMRSYRWLYDHDVTDGAAGEI